MSRRCEMPWCAAHQAVLVRMAADRKSAREIGNELGRSRMSVIGRANRTGVHLQIGTKDGADAFRRWQRENRGPFKPKAPKRPPKKPTLREVVKMAAPPPNTGGMLFLSTGSPELTRECRWIDGDPLAQAIGELRCCGEPTHPGQSYCAWHTAKSLGEGTASERAATRLPVARAA